nr:JAB domain-containing protein [uncultured Ruminococcus sp.]
MASSNGSDHKGHRERLRKRFIENGLDGFEEHQALELFLFYAIPRKDTNPLAHRLLERYRSISGVCDAPIDELQRDFGISENAAALLKLLPEMSRLYNESRLAKDSIIDLDTLGEIVKKKFIGRTAEVVVLILGDAKGKMVYFDVVSKGSVNSSDFPVRRIVELAIRHNARIAVIAHNHPSGNALPIAHNHPSGNALPSRTDLNTTKLIADTLRGVGVSLLDHYIVADNDYISLRESHLM